MIQPDLSIIIQHSLTCQGFTKAHALATKLLTFSDLCTNLLSPQVIYLIILYICHTSACLLAHLLYLPLQSQYDWKGLRGLKTIVLVAGKMKRYEDIEVSSSL